jgi:hypothetical protein
VRSGQNKSIVRVFWLERPRGLEPMTFGSGADDRPTSVSKSTGEFETPSPRLRPGQASLGVFRRAGAVACGPSGPAKNVRAFVRRLSWGGQRRLTLSAPPHSVASRMYVKLLPKRVSFDVSSFVWHEPPGFATR